MCLRPIKRPRRRALPRPKRPKNSTPTKSNPYAISPVKKSCLRLDDLNTWLHKFRCWDSHNVTAQFLCVRHQLCNCLVFTEPASLDDRKPINDCRSILSNTIFCSRLNTTISSCSSGCNPFYTLNSVRSVLSAQLM